MPVILRPLHHHSNWCDITCILKQHHRNEHKKNGHGIGSKYAVWSSVSWFKLSQFRWWQCISTMWCFITINRIAELCVYECARIHVSICQSCKHFCICNIICLQLIFDVNRLLLPIMHEFVFPFLFFFVKPSYRFDNIHIIIRHSNDSSDKNSLHINL